MSIPLSLLSLTLTGDIVRQHLSDAEAGTIRKIINDLH